MNARMRQNIKLMKVIFLSYKHMIKISSIG